MWLCMYGEKLKASLSSFAPVVFILHVVVTSQRAWANACILWLLQVQNLVLSAEFSILRIYFLLASC